MVSGATPAPRRRNLWQLFRQKSLKQPTAAPLVRLAHSTQQPDNTPPAAQKETLPIAIPSPFKRNKRFEQDIARLSVIYILQHSPELKRLIRLIVEVRANDENDELVDALETCAKFSFQLASALSGPHPEETIQAIIEFTRTIQQINNMPSKDGAPSSEEVKDMVDGALVGLMSTHPSLAREELTQNPSRTTDFVIGGSLTILDFVKEASEMIPVPLVKPAVTAIANLLKSVDQTRTNFNIMKQITSIAGEFVVSLTVHCSVSGVEPSCELRRAVNGFTKTLEGIAEECEVLSKLNPFWRLLRQGTHATDLNAMLIKLNSAIDLFQIESQVKIKLDIEDLGQKMDHAALSNLPHHPYYEHDEYLAGSREDVIRDISDYIAECDELVIWVHGAAGLGKSTMAAKLISLLDSDDRLAGGIFLANLTREHPNQVVQMIARQLGEKHPRAIPDIIKAAKDLDAPHHALGNCLGSYIIDPIRQLSYPYQLVVVIDGLDEWTNREAFLLELEHLPLPSPVKFVLTSRYNPSIEQLLLKAEARPYTLLPVSKEIIENYFMFHFEKINWRGRKPDQTKITRLADRADGLLIWAATIRALLSYEFDDRPPHITLDHILSEEENVGAKLGQKLERLYRTTVSSLFPNPNEQTKFAKFFGAIMVLQEPLSITDFARLVGMAERPAEEVNRRLRVLQTHCAVQSDAVMPAAQRFHMSFLEFMQSRSTQDDHRIPIIMEDVHSALASRCIDIVFSELLVPHGWRGRSCTHLDLHPFELYAVKFWPSHVSNSVPRTSDDLSTIELGRAILQISEEAMRQWGRLFLPGIAVEPQDGPQFLDGVKKNAIPLNVALTIGRVDGSTAVHEIHCLEVGVRLQPDDVDTWDALGEAYRVLYDTGRNSKHLDEEIVVLKRALELTLDGSTAAANAQYRDIIQRLALAYSSRFSSQGEQNDLDESIALYREGLTLRPSPDSDRAQSLYNLALALCIRSFQRGTLGDLDEAIVLDREALSLCPIPHPMRSLPLNNLANALRSRFEQQNTRDDLDEAIRLLQEALSLCPALHPGRPSSLSNLASAIFTRYEHQRTPSDLDEATELQREALSLRPASNPNRSLSLNNLASTLRAQFLERGVRHDLEEAIELSREAIDLCPTRSPDRSQLLDNLANCLSAHFDYHNAEQDVIDEAIALHREALALRPAPHSLRPASLSNLAFALWIDYLRDGTRKNLDEAILLNREAVFLRPVPHPERYGSLTNLANLLCVRSKLGDPRQNDLDEAVLLYRETISVCSGDHTFYFASVVNLVRTLQSRFNLTNDLDDLDEIISVCRQFMGGNHDKWSRLWLSAALKSRYELTGDQKDVEESINLEGGG